MGLFSELDWPATHVLEMRNRCLELESRLCARRIPQRKLHRALMRAFWWRKPRALSLFERLLALEERVHQV